MKMESMGKMVKKSDMRGGRAGGSQVKSIDMIASATRCAGLRTTTIAETAIEIT